MTLTECKDIFQSVYDERPIPTKNEPTCDAYGGAKAKKFCKFTTQTKCHGCRFYQPTFTEQKSMLAEYIQSKREEVEGLEYDKECLEDKLETKDREATILALKARLYLLKSRAKGGRR